MKIKAVHATGNTRHYGGKNKDVQFGASNINAYAACGDFAVVQRFDCATNPGIHEIIEKPIAAQTKAPGDKVVVEIASQSETK